MTSFEYACEPLHVEPDPDIDFDFGDWYRDEGYQRFLVKRYLANDGPNALNKAIEKYVEQVAAATGLAADACGEAIRKMMPAWAGLGITVTKRTPAEQSSIYNARHGGKGLSLHAAWADEAIGTWGGPYEVGHGAAMHFEFLGGPFTAATGYQGRAARRREARGKDPYDDPSRDRTSPTGFRPANRTRPPRNL